LLVPRGAEGEAGIGKEGKTRAISWEAPATSSEVPTAVTTVTPGATGSAVAGGPASLTATTPTVLSESFDSVCGGAPEG